MENKQSLIKGKNHKPVILTEEKKKMLMKLLPLYSEYKVPQGKIFESFDDDSSKNGITYADHDVISKSVLSWYRQGNNYMPTKVPNVNTLSAGLYDIMFSQDIGLYVARREVILDELFMLPDPSMIEIVDDLEKFWTRKDKYKAYGITYKRGVMLYGLPGTGKSSNINLLIKKVIGDYNGIVLNVDRLSNFIPMVKTIRNLEPEKPIMAVIEDIDSFVYENSIKDFLNVLDGNLQVDNIIYIGSTNYIEKLEPRLLRCSRFDLLIEIGLPTDLVRKTYITNKLKPEDLQNINVDRWVKDSRGFTISHLKEMIISICIMDQSYDKTLERLRQTSYQISDDHQSRGYKSW